LDIALRTGDVGNTFRSMKTTKSRCTQLKGNKKATPKSIDLKKNIV